MKQHDKPCKECPFSKKAEPGTLGGSTVETYIGQGYGPFLLACHMAEGYWQNRRDPSLPQCAGAAVFRANCGVAGLMPKGLLRLPPGPESFSSPAELYAHHNDVDVAEAKGLLPSTAALILSEINKAQVEVVKGVSGGNR